MTRDDTTQASTEEITFGQECKTMCSGRAIICAQIIAIVLWQHSQFCPRARSQVYFLRKVCAPLPQGRPVERSHQRLAELIAFEVTAHV